MGDCYSVKLKIKLKPNVKKTNLAKAMRQWMTSSRRENQAHFSLAESRRIGIRPDSFAGICKIIMAFHQGDGRVRKDGDFDVYASAFKATYSWLMVLERFFNTLAWALEDGSTMEIDRDSGHDYYKIIEGQAWERHQAYEVEEEE